MKISYLPGLILILILPLAGFAKTVVQRTKNGMIIEITPEINHFQVKNEGRTFDFWDFDDAGRYGRQGQPWLPVRGLLIYAPEGTGLAVTAKAPEFTDNVLPGPIPVLPKRDRVFKPKFSMDKQAYSVAGPWPRARAWLDDRGIMAGVPVARLVIAPVAYDGARSRVTTWRKIRVVITYPVSAGHTAVTPSRVVRGTDTPENQPVQDRYLVITADRLANVLSDWVAFRKRQGIAVDVVPVSIAGPTWDRIKTFIHDRYFSENRPTMVLLVGDSDTVPPAQGGIDCQYCPSDYLYSMIDGNDWYGDVEIGRWSAQDTAQVIDQANRDMMYETMPGKDQGASFVGSAVVISSSQGDGTFNDDISAQKTIDRLATMNYQLTALFHSDETDTVTRISGAINQGAGLIYYYGHGSGKEWSTTRPPFTTEDVTALENGPFTPFIMDVSCLNGSFTRDDGDCLAEAWVYNGGLACFSSTTETAWNEPTIMASGFTRAMQTDSVHTAAMALSSARAYMIQQQGLTRNVKGVLQQYILFGDPGQVIYTKPPVPLDVEFPDIAYKTDANLEITVKNNGVSVKGALVVLHNEDVSLRILTDENGKSVFDISLIKTGDYTVFARAVNALPFYGNIRINSDNCPDIRVDAPVISCSGSVETRVYDKSADTDSTKEDTIQIDVGNEYEDAIETGPDTGVFQTLFSVPPGAVNGQKIELTYQSAGDCAAVTTSITTDCQAPACDILAVDPVRDDGFGIVCVTNEPARLYLDVFGSNGYSNSINEIGFTINHHLMVNGLKPATKYEYALNMKDLAGNAANEKTGIVTTDACVPRCMDRECGDDHCGGKCGLCYSDQTCENSVCTGGEGCVATRTPGCDNCPCESCVCRYDHRCCDNEWDSACVDVCQYLCDEGCGSGCTPSCDSRQCGPDGCGGSCGKCAEDQACSKGQCVDISKCGNGTCDQTEDCVLCPADCTCATGEKCMETGECCVLKCDSRQCGPDGCGGSCGKCDSDHDCVNGHCNYRPVCGDGTCDQTEDCSTCPSDCVCQFGACKAGKCVCLPLCQGRQCGPDKCGGTCGKCDENTRCVQGVCVTWDTDPGFMPDVAEPKTPESGGCATSSRGSYAPWILFLLLIALWFARKKRKGCRKRS